jgi:hypothetical protein
VQAEVSGESALPMEEAVAYADSNYAKLVRYRADFEREQAQM